MVNQISVFLENSKGHLAHMTRVLADEGIDLLSLSIADTTDYGILRALVSDSEKAMKVLKAAGYTARITKVLAVSVPDIPGGLAQTLERLDGSGISIEYLYSFVHKQGESAWILFKVADPVAAKAILLTMGIKTLSHDDLLG